MGCDNSNFVWYIIIRTLSYDILNNRDQTIWYFLHNSLFYVKFDIRHLIQSACECLLLLMHEWVALIFRTFVNKCVSAFKKYLIEVNMHFYFSVLTRKGELSKQADAIVIQYGRHKRLICKFYEIV